MWDSALVGFHPTQIATTVLTEAASAATERTTAAIS